MAIKVGLGTVQLGQPYGNKSHSPLMPPEEAADILKTALAGGIRFFDTAIAYGESERRLGDYGLAANHPDVEISTKIPAAAAEVWQNAGQYERFVFEHVHASRKRLGLTHFGLLQFHQSGVDFLQTPHVGALMTTLIDSEACSHIGISVYTPEEAKAALNIHAVSALQIPVNLLDTRFIEPSLVAMYKQRQTRLIARSVLFQGVLVDNAAIAPVKRASDLKHLRNECLALLPGTPYENLTAMALAFALYNCSDVLDVALLGVDSHRSLAENLRLIKECSGPLLSDTLTGLSRIQKLAQDLDLINPGRWDH